MSDTTKTTINVVRNLVVRLADGTERTLKAGVHEVEEHIASHWFVKANSKKIANPTTPAPAAAATPAATPKKQETAKKQEPAKSAENPTVPSTHENEPAQ